MADDILKKLNTDMAKIFTISYKEIKKNKFILSPNYYAKKQNIEQSRQAKHKDTKNKRIGINKAKLYCQNSPNTHKK